MRMRRHLVERAYVVGHQVRTGGAVHADAQQVVILDGSVERVDGLAAQHGAGAFDGDAGHHGDIDAEIAPSCSTATSPALRLPVSKQVSMSR